jgi:hypothetical protein
MKYVQIIQKYVKKIKQNRSFFINIMVEKRMIVIYSSFCLDGYQGN